jgi:hypothetical protein
MVRANGALDPFMAAVLAQRAFGGGPEQVEESSRTVGSNLSDYPIAI